MTPGKVFLIGAGPGPADLISLRGRRALISADAILVDRLLPRTFLDDLEISTSDKEVEFLANKRPKWSQHAINAWLTAQSQRGRIVARLKGGDPFVFGQAEDETGHLSKVGIPWEAIPGPSSFTAALTEAGFPLTRRGCGRGFAVTTGRIAGGDLCADLPKSDSLVILMGAGVVDRIAKRLLADHWPEDTPAAIVERGTMPWGRRVVCTLKDLAATAHEANIAPPACLVVGAAAVPLFASRHRPTILFTGLDPENFRPLGTLLHWPALEIVPSPEAYAAFSEVVGSFENHRYDWVLVAGKGAVRSLFEAIDLHNRDARLLAGTRIAATDARTAHRLREHGIRPDLLGKGDSDETLIDRIDRMGRIAGKSVLLVEGTHCPRKLHDRLSLSGAKIHRLALSRIVPNSQLGRPLPPHEIIYFVSPSGVHSYYRMYGPAAFENRAWCLGKETQDTLNGYGVEADVVRCHEFAATDVRISA